jgi:electron transfer flavoprotein alpha subunit
MTALVIAEHDNASVKGATLNTVTAAAAAVGEVHVLIAGHNAACAAEAAAKIAGVAKVLHAEAPGFEHGLAENLAAHVVALAGSYSHLVFPATAAGKNVAPRVAALLDVAQVSDITKVISADTYERPIYAGNEIATVQSLDKTHVVTVRTTGFEPAAATGGSAAVEKVNAVTDNGSSSFVGSEIAKNDRPELTAAKIIVSGGRAMGSSDKFDEVLTPLADKLGAALGASRAAVDAGYAQRLAGRADRQDRRAAAVHRRGHLRRDPALGRHEGLEGHRRDQSGSRGADLQRGRLRPGGRPVHRRARAGEGALTTATSRR